MEGVTDMVKEISGEKLVLNAPIVVSDKERDELPGISAGHELEDPRFFFRDQLEDKGRFPASLAPWLTGEYEEYWREHPKTYYAHYSALSKPLRHAGPYYNAIWDNLWPAYRSYFAREALWWGESSYGNYDYEHSIIAKLATFARVGERGISPEEVGGWITSNGHNTDGWYLLAEKDGLAGRFPFDGLTVVRTPPRPVWADEDDRPIFNWGLLAPKILDGTPFISVAMFQHSEETVLETYEEGGDTVPEQCCWGVLPQSLGDINYFSDTGGLFSVSVMKIHNDCDYFITCRPVVSLNLSAAAFVLFEEEE